MNWQRHVKRVTAPSRSTNCKSQYVKRRTSGAGPVYIGLAPCLRQTDGSTLSDIVASGKIRTKSDGAIFNLTN